MLVILRSDKQSVDVLVIIFKLSQRKNLQTLFDFNNIMLNDS